MTPIKAYFSVSGCSRHEVATRLRATLINTGFTLLQGEGCAPGSPVETSYLLIMFDPSIQVLPSLTAWLKEMGEQAFLVENDYATKGFDFVSTGAHDA